MEGIDYHTCPESTQSNGKIRVAFIKLSLNLFVKIDLQVWLDKPFDEPPEPMPKYVQGVIFQ